VKFIVFDMDGILLDTSRCHARAYADLWQRYRVEGPEYSLIAGRPTREVVEPYTRDVAEWVAFKQERAREYLRSDTVRFSDVQPCLEAIHAIGYGMGVATGASRRTAEMLLDGAGIAGFFRFVLTAEDVSRGKPHPEIYRRAAELAGMETVVAEDSAAGLQAAACAPTLVASIRSGLTIESPYFVGSFPTLVEFTEALGVEVG
jgi:HAD superfamily hydrolase (TIGR01509 family)